jgi:hypothetical protein
MTDEVLSVDHFIQYQQVVKLCGQYAGMFAIVTMAFPLKGCLKSHIKIRITKEEMNKFPKEYHSAIGRFLRKRHDVGLWRPALMYKQSND